MDWKASIDMMSIFIDAHPHLENDDEGQQEGLDARGKSGEGRVAAGGVGYSDARGKSCEENSVSETCSGGVELRICPCIPCTIH